MRHPRVKIIQILGPSKVVPRDVPLATMSEGGHVAATTSVLTTRVVVMNPMVRGAPIDAIGSRLPSVDPRANGKVPTGVSASFESRVPSMAGVQCI